MGRLVHAGSAVVDHIYLIDRLPAPGAEKIAHRHWRTVGGGFNMMAAARRADMKVAFAGRHGTGPNGDMLRSALLSEGIDILADPFPETDTGDCVVLVTDDAERTFVSSPGAESGHTDDELASITLEADDWVFVSGYTLSYSNSRDALARWIEALPATVPLVFDPTPAVEAIPRTLLERVLARTTWLSCNLAEAAVIAGINTPGETLARPVLALCPQAAGLVLRSGPTGAWLCLKSGENIPVPGFNVTAVDTNGAGDTHIGAFVAALARGEKPMDAVRYANAAAALSVTRVGGAGGPSYQEIRAFLETRQEEAKADQTGGRKTARL